MIPNIADPSFVLSILKNPYYLHAASISDTTFLREGNDCVMYRSHITKPRVLRAQHIEKLLYFLLLKNRFNDIDIDEFHRFISYFVSNASVEMDMIDNNHRSVYLISKTVSTYREDFISFAFLDDFQTFWFYRSTGFHSLSQSVQQKFLGIEPDDLTLPQPTEVVFPTPFMLKEMIYVLKRVTEAGAYDYEPEANLSFKTEELLIQIIKHCMGPNSKLKI